MAAGRQDGPAKRPSAAPRGQSKATQKKNYPARALGDTAATAPWRACCLTSAAAWSHAAPAVTEKNNQRVRKAEPGRKYFTSNANEVTIPRFDAACTSHPTQRTSACRHTYHNRGQYCGTLPDLRGGPLSGVPPSPHRQTIFHGKSHRSRSPSCAHFFVGYWKGIARDPASP